jgi:hypothetical protein
VHHGKLGRSTSAVGQFSTEPILLAIDVRLASKTAMATAPDDLAFVQLASIRLWLRANESTP